MPHSPIYGPWVAAGFVCRTVEVDDGGTRTYRQWLDRVSFLRAPQTPEEADSVWIVVGFAWELPPGPMRVTLTATITGYAPVELASEEHAFNDPHGLWLTHELRLNDTQSGTIWFDVILDDKRMTRFPLIVQDATGLFTSAEGR